MFFFHNPKVFICLWQSPQDKQTGCQQAIESLLRCLVLCPADYQIYHRSILQLSGRAEGNRKAQRRGFRGTAWGMSSFLQHILWQNPNSLTSCPVSAHEKWYHCK